MFKVNRLLAALSVIFRVNVRQTVLNIISIRGI